MADDLFNEFQKKILKNIAMMGAERLGISEHAAELRINAILASGIMKIFNDPEDEAFMFAIDIAMRIPQLGEKEQEK